MKLTNFEQTLKVSLWDHQQQQKQQHLSNTGPIFWDHQQENEQQQQKNQYFIHHLPNFYQTLKVVF